LSEKGKSALGSAVASAEALMTFMEIMNSQAQEYAVCQWRGAPHTFQILEAEDGKAVRKDYELEETIYPGGMSGKYVVIKRENSFWIKFDITHENEYDFYLVYLRQTGFDMGTSVMMRVDGDKIFPVPLGGAPDSPYMYMKDVLDTRVLLPGPHSLGIRFSGLLHSKAAIVDSVLLQPVIEWKVLADEQGGVLIFAKSFQKNDREVRLESFGIPNIHATSVMVYTVNGTLATQRKDDLTASSSIKIPGYGYALIRGK
jgi:hypothetical protein